MILRDGGGGGGGDGGRYGRKREREVEDRVVSNKTSHGKQGRSEANPNKFHHKSFFFGD